MRRSTCSATPRRRAERDPRWCSRRTRRSRSSVVAQAERLGARLAGAGIARPSGRATCRARRDRRGASRAAPARRSSLDADLQERNYGAIRGTPYAKLTRGHLRARLRPTRGRELGRVPRAGRPRMGARPSRARGASAARSPVVTHGLVCWSILSRHVTATAEPPASMRFGNTSVTILDGPTPWRAALVDCTAHLDGAGGRAATRVSAGAGERPVVVLTGATSGIGRAAATPRDRAQGARLVLIARDRGARPPTPSLTVADTTGQPRRRRRARRPERPAATCARSPRRYARGRPRIDVLLNNAGRREPPLRRRPTASRRRFAVNHLAYFMLTPASCATRSQAAPRGAHRQRRVGRAPLGPLDFDDLGTRAPLSRDARLRAVEALQHPLHLRARAAPRRVDDHGQLPPSGRGRDAARPEQRTHRDGADEAPARRSSGRRKAARDTARLPGDVAGGRVRRAAGTSRTGGRSARRASATIRRCSAACGTRASRSPASAGERHHAVDRQHDERSGRFRGDDVAVAERDRVVRTWRPSTCRRVGLEAHVAGRAASASGSGPRATR